MPEFKAIRGGYDLLPDDKVRCNRQKAITKTINERFIQVGATFLKAASKFPVDDDWHKKLRGDVDLQAWIDDEEISVLNGGFNLQFGWTDIDIDASDVEYNRAIAAGLAHVGVDMRFGFGRASVGVPSHYLVQLPEEEARLYEELRKFQPKESVIDGKRVWVEIRSMATNVKEINLVKSAKQTVVPGSVYSAKVEGSDYDLSVWYGRGEDGDLGVARAVTDIASTTPRATSFTSIVRGITFGTIAHVLRGVWVEGGRQRAANVVTGWLARIVRDSQSVNEHEVISKDVFCPIDNDGIAESLIKFICSYFDDDEPSMRIRSYYDALDKLDRNPDARVPGWVSMQELVGAEYLQAIRTVLMPGSDVSRLTEMVERYVYDESDNSYIDRKRHSTYAKFVHTGEELDRRHKGDTLFVGGKPREAFKVYESSTLRKRVGFRDMYPDLAPGSIYRIDNLHNVVPDEADVDASTVFNTWKGWPIGPASVVDAETLRPLVERLDRLLGLLTREDTNQIEWVKDWIAWIFQQPGDKQQIAWVVMGDQGVGKSFFGNIFMRALLTERLWSSASPKILDQNFTIGPFKEKMFCFIDEADFSRNHAAVDEIKKLIRNTDVSGMEKFEEARSYRIFSRLMFASNKQNIGISQRDVRDRALFYTRTYDAAYLGKTEPQFRAWAEELKPFFEEFANVLKQRSNISAYLRFFFDRPVDRHKLESIKFSSGDDPEIAAANMSWSRRVAKGLLESGYVAYNDLAWEQPFGLNELNARIIDECKSIGISSVRADAVLSEFKGLGLLDVVVDTVYESTVRLFRFKRWGECVRAFEKATSLSLTLYRELDDADFGDHDTKHRERPPRRGIRASKF